MGVVKEDGRDVAKVFKLVQRDKLRVNVTLALGTLCYCKRVIY